MRNMKTMSRCLIWRFDLATGRSKKVVHAAAGLVWPPPEAWLGMGVRSFGFSSDCGYFVFAPSTTCYEVVASPLSDRDHFGLDTAPLPAPRTTREVVE